MSPTNEKSLVEAIDRLSKSFERLVKHLVDKPETYWGPIR